MYIKREEEAKNSALKVYREYTTLTICIQPSPACQYKSLRHERILTIHSIVAFQIG